jgi:hypothetical protein
MSSQVQQSSILDLAKSILADAEIVDAHLKQNGIPQPSFEEGSTDMMSVAGAAGGTVWEARMALLEKCREVHDLLLGGEQMVLAQDSLVSQRGYYSEWYICQEHFHFWKEVTGRSGRWKGSKVVHIARRRFMTLARQESREDSSSPLQRHMQALVHYVC